MGFKDLAEEYIKDKRASGGDGQSAEKDMLKELMANAGPILTNVMQRTKPTRSSSVQSDSAAMANEVTPTTAESKTPTFETSIEDQLKQGQTRLSRWDKHQMEKTAAGVAGVAALGIGGSFALVRQFRSSRSRSKSKTRSETASLKRSSTSSYKTFDDELQGRPLSRQSQISSTSSRNSVTVPRPLPASIPPGLYLASLSPSQHRKIQHASAAILYREPVFEKILKSYQHLIDMLEHPKHKGPPQRLFGEPLKKLVKYQGIDSSHTLSGQPVRIPIFLDSLITAFKRVDCTTQGILRKSPSLAQLERIVQMIDTSNGRIEINLAQLDPIMLGALLKRFLSNLPDPILTGTLFKMFIVASHVKNAAIRKRLMHLTLCMLPKVNRDVVEIVFVFLAWLSGYAHVDVKAGNGMDLSNIAKVMAPTLIRPTHRQARMNEVGSMNKAVLCLLEDQHILNEVPFELAQALHVLVGKDESTESFLRKMEHFLRLS